MNGRKFVGTIRSLENATSCNLKAQGLPRDFPVGYGNEAMVWREKERLGLEPFRWRTFGG